MTAHDLVCTVALALATRAPFSHVAQMLDFTICFVTALARHHAAIVAAAPPDHNRRPTEELLAYGLIAIHRQLNTRQVPATAAQLQVCINIFVHARRCGMF